MKVLSFYSSLLDDHDSGVAGQFLRIRLATALENLKDYSGALSHYQWLANNDDKVLAAKHYTDLGRMYLLTGNKEKPQVVLNMC